MCSNSSVAGERSSKTAITHYRVEWMGVWCQHTQSSFSEMHWSFRIVWAGPYFTSVNQHWCFCGEMAARNQYFPQAIWRDDNHLGWYWHTNWHTDGRSIRQPPTVDDLMALVMRTLGVTRRYAMDELEQVWGTSIRLEWLCTNFSGITDADMEARIQSASRTYLLYLAGCTLFSNKRGIRVFTSYLKLFEDFGGVSRFAWGTIALAVLCR